MKEILKKLNACEPAIKWAGNRTIEEIVRNCERGDWLLWLAIKINIDLQTLTIAKARCTMTVINLMKDERSITAVKVAEQFGLGKATIEELKTAATAAYAAYAAAAATAAYATAADAADADAAAYAADAAAYAAAYSAYAAATAAYAAVADAAMLLLMLLMLLLMLLMLLLLLL